GGEFEVTFGRLGGADEFVGIAVIRGDVQAHLLHALVVHDERNSEALPIYVNDVLLLLGEGGGRRFRQATVFGRLPRWRHGRKIWKEEERRVARRHGRRFVHDLRRYRSCLLRNRRDLRFFFDGDEHIRESAVADYQRDGRVNATPRIDDETVEHFQ